MGIQGGSEDQSTGTSTSAVRGFVSKVTDRTQVVMGWQRPWSLSTGVLLNGLARFLMHLAD